MATALFDSGLPIEYRSAATEDLCQGFGTKAIQLVKEKQMLCPEDQRLLLEAIASGTQEGLPVCLQANGRSSGTSQLTGNLFG